MITINISGVERVMDDIDEHWIVQQINGRRRDGLSVWVLVRIQIGTIDILLMSDNCPRGGGGGGRPPNRVESELFDLWNRFELRNGGLKDGQLIAFLKQVRRLI